MRNIALIAFVLLGLAAGEAKAIGPWVVFFGPADTGISPQAAGILDNFALSWKMTQNADVELLGHTDRAGSASFNRGFSCARAIMVRDYLMGRGVPEERIRISGWGELRPLVETPDRVAEPQNRRVELILVADTRSAGPTDRLFSNDPLPRKEVDCLSKGKPGARARA